MHFKFFVLDYTGRIDRAIECDCRDEADATAFAELISEAFSIEIWRGRTLLTTVMSRQPRFADPPKSVR